LEVWAHSHPAPDRPVFGYTGLGFVSPRQLVSEVKRESHIGYQYLQDVRRLTARVPFDSYLTTIERCRLPWWRKLVVRVRTRDGSVQVLLTRIASRARPRRRL